jgi:hypothetical protein
VVAVVIGWFFSAVSGFVRVVGFFFLRGFNVDVVVRLSPGKLGNKKWTFDLFVLLVSSLEQWPSPSWEGPM